MKESLQKQVQQWKSLREQKIRMKLVIIGKSGQGKVLQDIASCLDFDTIISLDDNPELHADGAVNDFEKYIADDTQFVVAIGNSDTREQIANMLASKGAQFATLVHPSAVISKEAHLGEGTVVMANAVVNPGAVVGNHVIINTTAVVEHDCFVEDYSHISVGAKMGGTCNIGKHVWLGIGAIVSNNINICDKAYIGAGAVVVKDIKEAGIYVGIPAVLMKY